MVQRIRLGELLVRAGILDEPRLNAALAEQKRWGGRLGKILVQMGFLTEDLLVKALSKQLGIPRADLSNVHVPQQIIAKIDAEELVQQGICPIQHDAERRVLTVAMSDPTRHAALDGLRFRTGLKIEAAIAGDMEIAQLIERFFGLSARPPSNGAPTREAETGRAPSSPSPMVQRPSEPSTAEMKASLEMAQRQQQRAIRALLDLLIEKGVFSRDEYFAAVRKQ